jgi:predicted PurR-regulated permease PerM
MIAGGVSPRITRRLHRPPAPGSEADAPDVVEVESVELSGVFSAPQWLRDLGFASWLLAGVGAVLIGATWIASLTSTIVVPVVVAGVVAAVTSPLVRLLGRRGLPRGAGAALVFLGLLVLGAALVVMIVGGVTSQASELSPKLAQGADKIQGWLQDLGVSSGSAEQANSDASAGLSKGFHALVTGVATGIEALASLAVFLSFTALSLFFFLKDGPVIRTWAERHLGVPPAVAHIVLARTLESLRGYFVGVTAVAAFNGIVIGLGALIVGVPQAGSIAIVNFAAAYVPFLGAWSAGAFTVLIALGAQGTEAAIAMAVIVLLANGALQQLVQPIAMGAALGIHPLAVLVVTIAAGALLGIVGMVLAAPLLSAAVRISADLAASRERANADAPVSDRVEPPPGAPQPGRS